MVAGLERRRGLSLTLPSLIGGEEELLLMEVKHLCERGMETNFKNAAVFIQQILAGFVSCLWKTCTLAEFLSLR